MTSATYISTLDAFTRFLAAYTHTLLYIRALYPRTSFVRARLYNTPVHQSRHPLVCQWIRDAITAVRLQLLSGSVARIAIVIYHRDPAITKGTGTVNIVERYMLDVSSFPVVDEEERNAVMEWQAPDLSHSDEDDDDEEGDNDVDGEHDETDKHDDNHGGDDENNTEGGDDSEGEGEGEGDNRELNNTDDDSEPRSHDESGEDENEHQPRDRPLVDLTEQFRSALIALITRCAQLGPLPPKSSFNISMELKDEAHIHPPLVHPQPWIPIPPKPQNTTPTNTKDIGHASEHADENSVYGVRITPVRTVEAGVFRFETWIEEGRTNLHCNPPAAAP